MPWALHRYQRAGHLHFVTFSCYRRAPLLTVPLRRLFESALDRTRASYGFLVFAYVVMPEHVHLLVNEPERAILATAIQAIKQSVSRRSGAGRFWEERYYDFNVFSGRKFVEKLRYIHSNPVKRGLVSSPEEWEWSSYRHYISGSRGAVEIESHWTQEEREARGIFPKLIMGQQPRPSKTG